MQIFKCARCGEDTVIPDDVAINENETVICDECYELLYGGIGVETIH